MNELELYIKQWVDDQIGLDCASYQINKLPYSPNAPTYIYIRTTLEDRDILDRCRTSTSMKQEWIDTALALINDLEIQGFGDWEIKGVNGIYCEVVKYV
jgi:hypothetical protein